MGDQIENVAVCHDLLNLMTKDIYYCFLQDNKAHFSIIPHQSSSLILDPEKSLYLVRI